MIPTTRTMPFTNITTTRRRIFWGSVMRIKGTTENGGHPELRLSETAAIRSGSERYLIKKATTRRSLGWPKFWMTALQDSRLFVLAFFMASVAWAGGGEGVATLAPANVP